MAAYGYETSTTTISRTSNWYVVNLTTEATATNVVTHWNGVVTYNCSSYDPGEPPKVPPEYLKLRRLSIYRDCREAQIDGGRSQLAALPRGKLMRWKSLKEKRQAWGFA